MNVIVILQEPMDLGVGADTRIEFVDAKFHAEPETEDGGGGRLSIQSESGKGEGNIATFRRGEWRAVIRGHVTEHPDNPAAAAPVALVRAAGAGK